MATVEKVCPVVFRGNFGRREALAFRHPNAGNQFVKGSIEQGENPAVAAVRELKEESGIKLSAPMIFFKRCPIGAEKQIWHFYYAEISGLSDHWLHQTEDDYGHVFSFFWHPVDMPLDDQWHSLFHEAMTVITQIG